MRIIAIAQLTHPSDRIHISIIASPIHQTRAYDIDIVAQSRAAASSVAQHAQVTAYANPVPTLSDPLTVLTYAKIKVSNRLGVIQVRPTASRVIQLESDYESTNQIAQQSTIPIAAIPGTVHPHRDIKSPISNASALATQAASVNIKTKTNTT